MDSSAAIETDPAILAQVKGIIRRDLKLGTDVVVSDEMPFFGTDVDLDSLDMLLLVTSIEKEFGIKVPSEAVGREVFQNVGTLTRYIQTNRGAKQAGMGRVPAGAASDPLARLPHADPFRFVTRLTEYKAGESATGVWVVTGREAFFTGHFPGRPMVPGVLIAEALAQLSGVAGPLVGGTNEQGKLVAVDVRFDDSVTPPAEIVLRTKVTRVMGSLQLFDVSAAVGGSVVTRGSLTLHRSAGSV